MHRMTDPRSVTVSIYGRDYTLKGEAEPAYVQKVAALVDQKMREIRDAGKLVGTERIAIMAALNIAHELLKLQVPGGFDLGDLKRRIHTMQSSIDSALSTQDKLF